MARDPHHTIEAAGSRAHQATKSTGRLLTATVGFSVAYFLDRQSGPARRAQVRSLVRRPLRFGPALSPAPADRDLPRIGLARDQSPPTFQRAVHEIRSIARA